MTCKYCRQPSHTEICPRCAPEWKNAPGNFTPAEDAGMVGNALVTQGYQGGADTFYREPQHRRDAHHDLPIVVGGELLFQSDPLVHVNGFAPGHDKGHRTVARQHSENEAHRQAIALEAELQARRSIAELAADLSVTPAKVARVKMRAPRRVK